MADINILVTVFEHKKVNVKLLSTGYAVAYVYGDQRRMLMAFV